MQLFSRPYAIPRFWVPREDALDLSDGGYPPDPTSELSVWHKPVAVPFESIPDHSCLALLGEPGSGKTTWFKCQEKAVPQRGEPSGCTSLWIDAAWCDKSDDLVSAVVQNEGFRLWSGSDYTLHLFIDGFDECCRVAPKTPAKLLHALRPYDLKRLRLRILCRAGEWPAGFEDDLTGTWKDKDFHAYRIYPLRRIDVEQVVRGELAESDSFLGAVEKRGLVSFAIRPQTLGFLIRSFRGLGKFPKDQVELFSAGCRALCDDINQGRLDAAGRGELGPDERLEIAARIAALTRFTGKSAIWTGPDSMAPSDANYLLIREIVDAPNLATRCAHPVGDKEVRETLLKGLFTTRGAGVAVWSHQAYVDYLAAHYVVKHDVSPDQTERLILTSVGGRERVPSRLRETASWLALMRPEIFEELVATDPDVLISRDYDYSPVREVEDLKGRLVNSLLNLLNQGKIVDDKLYGRSDPEEP